MGFGGSHSYGMGVTPFKLVVPYHSHAMRALVGRRVRRKPSRKRSSSGTNARPHTVNVVMKLV